jgi:hypothetical protein
VHPVPHPDQCTKKGIHPVLNALCTSFSEESPRIASNLFEARYRE